MVFSSLIFLCIFLPIVLIAYNLSKNITYKNIIITIASLIFYAFGEPVWVFLLIVSSILGYVFGLMIDYYKPRKPVGAKITFALSIITSLASLGFFKYLGFFADNINAIFNLSISVPEIALPIGISFYTFQILSYTIDVYNGKVNVQTSFLRFIAYVSLFPQLIAGPIVRYRDVSVQLRKRSVSFCDFAQGTEKFICGMCKKVLLANNAGAAADALLTGIHFTTMSSWLGILFYTFQIYFDFSGYSDMAIGLGSMFGFSFKENFEHPYISKSITEFWRRWHISLSTFFRDYVYIPLGGNRKHHILNIMIVWMLTGLWHGASWNFVLWGLFYGIILLIEKKLFNGVLQRLPSLPGRIYTMFIVLLGWTLFYFTDMSALKECLMSMFALDGRLYDFVSISALRQNLWLIIICTIACSPWPKVFFKHFSNSCRILSTVVEPLIVIAGFVLCFITLVGSSYNPFLYFRF